MKRLTQAEADNESLAVLRRRVKTLEALLDSQKHQMLDQTTRLEETLRSQCEQTLLLKASEAQYHSLVEAIPQQVWTARPDGTLDYVNHRVLDYFDCHPNDLLGWEWQSVLHPADLAGCLAAWSNALKTGEPYEIQFRLRRARDGEYRWHLARALPIKDDRNCILKWFGTNTDITEHKEIEETLRLNKQRHTRASTIGKLGVWELDVATGSFHSDENLRILFGYQDHDLSTDPSVWFSLVHPEDRHVAMTLWQSVITGESNNYCHELRMIQKDGTVIWTDVRGQAIRDVDGRLLQLLGTTVDITHRKGIEGVLQEKNNELEKLLVAHKEVEKALRVSEQQLHRFIAEAPIGLKVYDEDRRLLRTNKAFCAMIGYEEHELLGTACAHYTHPDDRAKSLIVLDQFYRGELKHYTLEKRYVRKSGEIIWASITATRLDVPGHDHPLRLVAVQDITKQRQALELREQLSQELHDNLLQSLYAVGMHLETGKLLMDTCPQESKTYVIEAISQLKQQVREIQQFIRSLEQQHGFSQDFGQALRQLVALFFTAGHEPPDLEVEDTALSKVTPEQARHLLNITREALSNSVRHSHATRRSVQLKHRGDEVCLTISDNGRGFSFTNQNRGGHGLANMSARARKINARCIVDSTPGKGTSVTVHLPKGE